MNYLNSLPLPNADLSPTETRRLLAQAQSGDAAARDTLVRANLRLAAAVVQRFAGRGDAEDLFQTACMGLLKAVDNFDLRFDVRFSTYAVPVMIGEIRRYLQQGKAVKVGRTMQERAATVLRIKEELTAELARSPTPSEIAARLGISREDVVAALDAAAPVRSLDEMLMLSDNETVRLADHIGIEGDEPALLENLALQQAYAALAKDEQLLVALRFFRNMRQTDVAKKLGVSQAQVSRLEKRAMLKLHGLLT